MRKLVTILLPAYNEEESFPDIEKCMNRFLLDNPDYDWEFLFVNDESIDNTLQQMFKLRNKYTGDFRLLNRSCIEAFLYEFQWFLV